MKKAIIATIASAIAALAIVGCGGSNATHSHTSAHTNTAPSLKTIEATYHLVCVYPQAPAHDTVSLTGCVDTMGRSIEVATFADAGKEAAFQDAVTKPTVFKGPLYLGILVG